MLRQWMNRFTSPSRQGMSFPAKKRTRSDGLTLVEVLGTLVILGFALTAVLFMVNQTHSGVNRIASREQIIDESRTIINHIVQASRRESAIVTADPSRSLVLQYESGDRVSYTFDATRHEFSYTMTTDGRTISGILSTHVGSVSLAPDSAARRIRLSLTMALPNGSAYNASTVVNLPSL